MTSSRQPKAAKAPSSEFVPDELAQPHVHTSIQKLVESVVRAVQRRAVSLLNSALSMLATASH